MTYAVWFADIDPDARGYYQWQPCLREDSGEGLASVQIWFQTKEQCDEFIATHLTYAGHDV